MSARITPDLLGLTQLHRLANRVGWKINGGPDTCLTPFLNLAISFQTGVIIPGSGAEFVDICSQHRNPDRLNDEIDGGSLDKVRRHL